MNITGDSPRSLSSPLAQSQVMRYATIDERMNAGRAKARKELVPACLWMLWSHLAGVAQAGKGCVPNAAENATRHRSVGSVILLPVA